MVTDSWSHQYIAWQYPKTSRTCHASINCAAPSTLQARKDNGFAFQAHRKTPQHLPHKTKNRQPPTTMKHRMALVAIVLVLVLLLVSVLSSGCGSSTYYCFYFFSCSRSCSGFFQFRCQFWFCSFSVGETRKFMCLILLEYRFSICLRWC